MSYTSGRTVRTRANIAPTTVVSATRDARRLVGKHLPGVVDVTVNSHKSADPETLAATVRTVITWPGRIEHAHVQLAMALTELPGYLRAVNDEHSITITRAA